MSEHARHDPQDWERLPPEQVIELLVYQLYNPVSILGSQIKRLTEDDDPLTEDEYDAIFEQMHHAVRELSKTVVHLKRYSEGRKGPKL
jgi:hypothetical protein